MKKKREIKEILFKIQSYYFQGVFKVKIKIK